VAAIGTKPPSTRRVSGIDLPPIEQDDRRGGGSRWVELTKASNDIDAHLLIGRLNEAGIETRSVKDRSQPGAWLYGGSNPWAPVAILVRSLDLDSARIVLAEVAFEAPAVEPERPPSPAARRRAATVWWVTAIVLGVTFTALIVAQASRATPGCQLPVLCRDS
jgi:Putative prokaryotic signal transducing protein